MKKEKVYKIKINLKSHELVNFLTSWDFFVIKIGSAVVKGEQKATALLKGGEAMQIVTLYSNT